MQLPAPTRVPILYLIFGVLIAVSLIPLWIYGTTVVDNESNRLKTNEQYLQNTITRSFGQDISQRQQNLETMMDTWPRPSPSQAPAICRANGSIAPNCGRCSSTLFPLRSEERRVGKEWRSRWPPY